MLKLAREGWLQMSEAYIGAPACPVMARRTCCFAHRLHLPAKHAQAQHPLHKVLAEPMQRHSKKKQAHKVAGSAAQEQVQQCSKRANPTPFLWAATGAQNPQFPFNCQMNMTTAAQLQSAIWSSNSTTSRLTSRSQGHPFTCGIR
jgi:hypothetical protein